VAILSLVSGKGGWVVHRLGGELQSGCKLRCILRHKTQSRIDSKKHV